MINALRWLLIVPLTVAGWFAVFVACLSSYDLILYFCPADDQVSGFCHHPAALFAESALIAIGSGLSAIVVILIATTTAPGYKAQVAAATLCLGFAVAVWAYLETYALGAFLSACVAGTVTCLWVLRSHRSQVVSDYHQYELFI